MTDPPVSDMSIPDFSFPAINLHVIDQDLEVVPATTISGSLYEGYFESARSTTRTALNVVITASAVTGLVLALWEFFTHFV